jgi:hypothetical protein
LENDSYYTWNFDVFFAGLQQVLELSKECTYLRAEVEGRHGALSPPASLEAFHLNKDLTACRNKINQLTSEL